MIKNVTAVIRKYTLMTNMLDGTNYFLQDILNFQPRVIFESYDFYHIWGQYFDPCIILGWRYTRVSTVVVTVHVVNF